MCLLKLRSQSHSFKSLAHQFPVPVYSVRDAGEVRRKTTGELWKDYTISFDVSNREWDDFPGQVADAIAFLVKYYDPLSVLLREPFISDAILDFPLWSRLGEDIVNQNDRLPRELVKLCGALGIGIEMAIYQRQAFVDIGMATPSDHAQSLPHSI